MNTLTQKLLFRQSVVLYSQRNSVFSAIRKFGISRATIYRWRKMYDGTLDSLAERSRRPHNHPNQHTSEEIKLISDMRRRNPEAGLVVFWVKLMQRDTQSNVYDERRGKRPLKFSQGNETRRLPERKRLAKIALFENHRIVCQMERCTCSELGNGKKPTCNQPEVPIGYAKV